MDTGRTAFKDGTAAKDELTGTTRIAGAQVETDEGPRKDKAWKRINFITNVRFEKVASADGGWSTLYRDPDDGRLWEKIYPKGHRHGGGPPLLRVRSAEKARETYALSSTHASAGPSSG